MSELKLLKLPVGFMSPVYFLMSGTSSKVQSGFFETFTLAFPLLSESIYA